MQKTRGGAYVLMVTITLLALGLNVAAQSTVKHAEFGKLPDGREVTIYTLTNSHRMEARIINYGGIITSLRVPDRHGRLDDVVLGFDSLEPYLTNPPYFGALIGRYANRIARGRFTLNGHEYTLAVNNGENHLHGGLRGFDKVLWSAKALKVPNGAALELSYTSKDGEEGYPGTLRTTVRYTLTNRNELRIDYSATTDQDTIVNLTSHSYFNLAGQGNGDVLNHEVMINATRFTPTDSGSIPTGKLQSVFGTPFDFTTARAIGARINQDDEQLKFGNGYDHNFVLNGRLGMLRRAARVSESSSGRVMEVWTTEPGLQFYTGNFLDGSLTGKEEKVYQRRFGFCLETQHFPDSPNEPRFPTTVLRKGARYHTTTIYKFSTMKG